jgi:predicted amidohydrolase YtcJ
MSTRVFSLLLALTLAACGNRPEHPHADVVVRNADVRTQQQSAPRASALAISGEKIAHVGDEQGIAAWIGPDTHVIDAGGRTILPGLIDTHIHAAGGALSLGGCTLRNKQLTIAQAAEPIRACIAADKTSTWIVVNEVNPAGFQANRHDLDTIESQRALFLWGADGHTAWVNSRGLELAGITRTTPDPEDGRIDRNARGEATGFLIDAATGLALSSMPQPSPEKRLEALRKVLPLLHGAGITSYLEANTDEPTVDAYVELARRHELTARVAVAFETSVLNTPAEFTRLETLRAKLADPLFRADFIKLFADGVLEYPTQTGALLEPYNDARGKPGKSHGQLYITPAEMNAFIAEAGNRGFNIHVHAIGDAAVRETLDAFAAARAAGSKQLFSIAHLQLIDAHDLSRFAALKVDASVQLLWAQPDNYSIDALTPWLGEARIAREYPGRSLIAAGANVAGGSDWDVSSYNPFEAMATAMSRRNPEDLARPPLNPGEALTLDEMLAAYTINAARLIGRDQEIGSLAAGKFADFIVLDRKLTAATNADEVRQTRPARVFFAGRDVTPANLAP